LKNNKIAKSIIRYFAELLIVFFGVYGAFLLSEYKSEKEKEVKKEQICSALIQEISNVLIRTDRVNDNLPKIINFYDSLLESGAMPDLVPRAEAVKVESHMWNASLASGAIDLLDIPLMYKISKFYNSLNAGLEQINQLRELSETILIPNLNKGKDEFYDLGTKKIKPKYNWYFEGLRNLLSISIDISKQGNEALAELKASTKHQTVE